MSYRGAPLLKREKEGKRHKDRVPIILLIIIFFFSLIQGQIKRERETEKGERKEGREREG